MTQQDEMSALRDIIRQDLVTDAHAIQKLDLAQQHIRAMVTGHMANAVLEHDQALRVIDEVIALLRPPTPADRATLPLGIET